MTTKTPIWKIIRGYEPTDYLDEHTALKEEEVKEPCDNFSSEGGICYVCHFNWRVHPQYMRWMGKPHGKEWRDVYLRQQEDIREANEGN